ncbi:MAG TPA: hypothetical protein VI727_07195 [Candidatus Brocadiaceae bacterium]|nr:hypothetical protein [Candidatus Brocadiaceae bacterium]
MKDLEKVTGKQYIFAGSPSNQDKIIAYAERLMIPLKKYGNPQVGYDFSKARTQIKSRFIIWVITIPIPLLVQSSSIEPKHFDSQKRTLRSQRLLKNR